MKHVGNIVLLLAASASYVASRPADNAVASRSANNAVARDVRAYPGLAHAVYARLPGKKEDVQAATGDGEANPAGEGEEQEANPAGEGEEQEANPAGEGEEQEANPAGEDEEKEEEDEEQEANPAGEGEEAGGKNNNGDVGGGAAAGNGTADAGGKGKGKGKANDDDDDDDDDNDDGENGGKNNAVATSEGGLSLSDIIGGLTGSNTGLLGKRGEAAQFKGRRRHEVRRNVKGQLVARTSGPIGNAGKTSTDAARGIAGAKRAANKRTVNGKFTARFN